MKCDYREILKGKNNWKYNIMINSMLWHIKNRSIERNRKSKEEWVLKYSQESIKGVFQTVKKELCYYISRVRK